MSNLASFATYAAAFEESLVDDDWARLVQYFAPDARYLPGDGTEAVGREASIEALKASVESLERKCDSRDVIGQPEISESGDTITLTYKLKYTKDGVGEFVLSGYETIQYADGLIQRMEDVFDDQAAMLDWRERI